jgi:hypothetical protein
MNGPTNRVESSVYARNEIHWTELPAQTLRVFLPLHPPIFTGVRSITCPISPLTNDPSALSTAALKASLPTPNPV